MNFKAGKPEISELRGWSVKRRPLRARASYLLLVMPCFVALGEIRANDLPIYRGKVLERETSRPVGNVVVEALLRSGALPSGQRMIGRTKTDAEGNFRLQLSVDRRDIVIVVSKKGSTTKTIDFGGQVSMMTELNHPLVIESNVSPKRENVLYSLKQEKPK